MHGDGNSGIDVGADDLTEGELRGVRAAGRALVLARVEGRLYAVDGVCTHAFALLEDGVLDGRLLRCPLHWAAFDVTTGANVEPPTCGALTRYDLRVVNGRVLVVTGE